MAGYWQNRFWKKRTTITILLGYPRMIPAANIFLPWIADLALWYFCNVIISNGWILTKTTFAKNTTITIPGYPIVIPAGHIFLSRVADLALCYFWNVIISNGWILTKAAFAKKNDNTHPPLLIPEWYRQLIYFYRWLLIWLFDIFAT